MPRTRLGRTTEQSETLHKNNGNKRPLSPRSNLPSPDLTWPDTTGPSLHRTSSSITLGKNSPRARLVHLSPSSPSPCLLLLLLLPLDGLTGQPSRPPLTRAPVAFNGLTAIQRHPPTLSKDLPPLADAAHRTLLLPLTPASDPTQVTNVLSPKILLWDNRQ